MVPGLVIKQYAYETASWGRLLSFFLQENVYFKNRLAEIVESAPVTGSLEEAEKFQEDFLAQDRVISFLSYELQKQNKLLEKEWFKDDDVLKEIIKNQKRLRKDIKKSEELFSKVKEDFVEYLSSRF